MRFRPDRRGNRGLQMACSSLPERQTKEHQMTSNGHASTRILGTVRSADGKGVVRMEDRLDTDIDDVW